MAPQKYCKRFNSYLENEVIKINESGQFYISFPDGGFIEISYCPFCPQKLEPIPEEWVEEEE